MAKDHTAPSYKNLSPLTPHIQRTSLTSELAPLPCNGDILATSQPKNVICCVTRWRVVRPHTRTKVCLVGKIATHTHLGGMTRGAANKASRPTPTSTYAHGVAGCASERTYIQHGTRKLVLELSSTHNMCTKRRKIESDRKEHLHEGIHDGNMARNPIVRMHIHISKREVSHTKEGQPEVGSNP